MHIPTCARFTGPFIATPRSNDGRTREYQEQSDVKVCTSRLDVSHWCLMPSKPLKSYSQVELKTNPNESCLVIMRL